MEIKISDYFTIQPTKLYSDERGKMYPNQQKMSDPLTQAYHAQLTDSLKAFQVKTWKPLKEKCCIPTITTSLPPKSHKHRSQNYIMSKNMLVVPAWIPPSRPVSVLSDNARPLSSYRRQETPDVQPGNFDTLNPEILSSLIGHERPSSVYVERCDIIVDSHGDTEASSTSDIDSDWSLLDDGDETEVDGQTVPDLIPRPEILDAIYVPENRKERKRYDFDANFSLIPPYEFKNILPKGSRYLDFSVIARQGLDWRNLTEMPQSQQIIDMFDRFIDLEKLQNDTIQKESGKYKPTSRRPPLIRSNSAKSRDKRCCNTCLQVACVGDCPDKSSSKCALCQKDLCGGSCNMDYEQHTRHLAVGEVSNVQSKQKTRLCSPCQHKHNAKYINANNSLLGRPRSSNATFSRGRNSVKPRDLRPKSAVEFSPETLRQFENLGLDPCQHTNRPSTAVSSRPRSRNGLLPGKNFSSNRKTSITDPKYKNTVSGISRAKSPKPKLYNPAS